MKRWMVVIGFVVALGMAAAPYFLGSRIEAAWRNGVQHNDWLFEQLVVTNPFIEGISFQLTAYDRHYRSATASGVLTLVLAVPEADGESWQVTIPLSSHIDHGPYLGKDGFALARVVSRLDGDSDLTLPAPVTADTVNSEAIVGFQGGWRGRLTLAPLRWHTEEGTVITYDGLSYVLTGQARNRLAFGAELTSGALQIAVPTAEQHWSLQPFKASIEVGRPANREPVDYQITTDRLRLTVNGTQLSAEALRLAGSYQSAPALKLTLGLGTQTLTLRGLRSEVDSAQSVPWILPELVVSHTLQQGERAGLDMQFSCHASLDQQTMLALASPVSLETAAVAVELQAIPAPVIESYQQLIVELVQAQTDPEDETAIDEALALGLHTLLPDVLRQLLQQATELRLVLNATAPEGALDVELASRFKPGQDLSAEALRAVLNRGDPDELVALLEGQGHLTLDRGLTEQAGLTGLIAMMGAPYIQLDDKVFRSVFRLEDGLIMVNDAPLPPALWFALTDTAAAIARVGGEGDGSSDEAQAEPMPAAPLAEDAEALLIEQAVQGLMSPVDTETGLGLELHAHEHHDHADETGEQGDDFTVLQSAPESDKKP